MENAKIKPGLEIELNHTETRAWIIFAKTSSLCGLDARTVALVFRLTDFMGMGPAVLGPTTASMNG